MIEIFSTITKFHKKTQKTFMLITFCYNFVCNTKKNAMKKTFLFALLLAFTAITASAQSNQRLTLLQATGAASDTVTNAGKAYVGRAFTGSATAIGVQVAITKVSGTVAGTITFQGSVDGTNYHTIGSTQSLTDTAGTKYYLFTLDGNLAPYTHYRASVADGTTCVYYISGTLIGKK